jgi:very-short-patch-repair endonuclease
MSTNRRKRPDNVPAARELRGRQTAAEDMLWEALRNRRLDGLKFRRQHPVGPFVLDFCCPDRRLAVEVDGAVHDTWRERDAEREDLLRAAGYRVLRFPNEVVSGDLASVLEAIRSAVESLPPRPAQPIARTTGW